MLTNGAWTDYDYIDFKKAFHRYDEDMSDVLEREELVQAMDLLRGNVWRAQWEAQHLRRSMENP